MPGQATAPPRPAAAAAPTPGPPAPPPPDGATETLDEGTFVVSVKGQPVGRERFAIRRGESIRVEHDSHLDIAGTALASRGSLTVGDDWKPRAGAWTSTIAGTQVEQTFAAGPPATLTVDTAGKKESVKAARDIDYFLLDNAMIHLTPVCRLPPEATTRFVFPGMELKVGAAVPVPESAPGPDLVRRAVDLGGALAVDVYCQRDRLLALDAPLQSLTAVREGSEALVAQARRKERTKPALPDGLAELPRKVAVPASAGVEAASLDCSLLVPATHARLQARPTGDLKPLPAVVFLTGSGLQDRDEDSYGPGGLKVAVFKVMAIELGKAGIASLRCDDRGSGASTGDAAKISLDSHLADAQAEIAALRAEPAIDPTHIGLIGHSEGGIVAPLAARKDRKLRALVLMAGTGRPIDVILLEQVERSARRAGLPQDKIDAELARYRAVLDAIRAGKPLPADVPEAERVQWESGRALFASHMKSNPAAVARRLKRVAVFIAQGDKDQQVAVADAEALRAAFTDAGNKKIEYKVYPDLNHLFAHSTTGNPSEYTDPDAVVDPGFLADVVRFLGKRLR